MVAPRVFVIPLCVMAMSSFARRSDTPRESLEVEKILDAAQSAPPEITADLKLKLVEKGLIKSKETRIRLLHEAFDLASSATFKLPLTITHAGASSQTDSDSGQLYFAALLQMDALSLQLRAVGELARSDPKAALDVFRSIPNPQIPALSCKDAMGYSLHLYYSTLGDLYNRAFAPDDRKKTLDFDFLTTNLIRPGSAFALQPAAHLLNTLNLPKDQLAQAITHYAQALANVPDDDRSFTAATNAELLDAIYSLAQKAQASEGPASMLVASLGKYLRDHMHADRCADTASSSAQWAISLNMIDDFNNRFHKLGPDVKNVPLLAAEDVQPNSLNGKAEVYVYWRKPSTKALMAEYKQLRFGSEEEQAADQAPTSIDNMPPYLGRTQRSRDAWLAKAADFLEKLDEWDVSDEPGTAAFHEKCIMYDSLLEIVPKGSLRNNVLIEYLQFLRNSSVERDRPPEWAFHLNFLLTVSSEENDKSEFIHAIAASGDGTMQAMAGVLQLTKSIH